MTVTSHSTFYTGLKIIIFIICLLLLLEISARVYYFGLPGLVPARINSVHGTPKTGFTMLSSLPDIGFELKPEIDGYLQLVPFKTNSQGLRDREYSLEKPQNTFRVAVVGSSFALPTGVDIEQAFHTLLEDRFTERFKPVRYEFINFAVGMYNPRQVLATLELRALAYKPDLVLFTTTKPAIPHLMKKDPPHKKRKYNLAKDSGNRPMFEKTYPFFQSYFARLMEERTGHGPKTPQFHVGAFEGLIIRVVEYLKNNDSGQPEEVNSALEQISDEETKQFVSTHGSVLQRLSQVKRKTGIPVVIVRLETDASDKHPIEIKVEKRIRSFGIHYLDTRDGFQGTQPSDFWIHELDPHPNWKANEIFAREIATFLETKDLLSTQPENL